MEYNIEIIKISEDKYYVKTKLKATVSMDEHNQKFIGVDIGNGDTPDENEEN